MYIRYTITHKPEEVSQNHFQVLSVNIVSYDANWHSTMHHHNFAEIFYCLDGSGYLLTEFGRTPIHKHSLLLVNPFIEHTEHTSLISPLKYLVIGIKGPEIILPSHATDNGLFSFEDSNHQFYRLIREVMTECELNQPYSSQIIDHLINSLILRLNNVANSQLAMARETPLSASVSLAKHYIDNHFSKNINLEQLVVIYHFSRFQLAHQFKEELGLSPINYLNQVRLTQAQELLLTTNYTVLQITEMVGFNSVSYFSNKFHEAVGMTPRAYRNLHASSLIQTRSLKESYRLPENMARKN